MFTGFNPARALGVSLPLLIFSCDFLVPILAWPAAIVGMPQAWRWLIYFIIRYYFLGYKLVNQVHLLNKGVGILRVLYIVLQLASQLEVDVTSVGLSYVHYFVPVKLEGFCNWLLDFRIRVFFKELQQRCKCVFFEFLWPGYILLDHILVGVIVVLVHEEVLCELIE